MSQQFTTTTPLSFNISIRPIRSPLTRRSGSEPALEQPRHLYVEQPRGLLARRRGDVSVAIQRAAGHRRRIVFDSGSGSHPRPATGVSRRCGPAHQHPVSGDRFAQWITDGPDPHGGTILAGSLSFTSGTALGFAVPRNLDAADEFWAQPAVESNLYPYSPGGPPSQIKSVQVAVDRSPGASIDVSPQVAVTGDTIHLVADAEGHPAVAGVGIPTPGRHRSIGRNLVLCRVSLRWTRPWREWSVDLHLDVQYEHEDPSQPGVFFTSSTRLARTIHSVSRLLTLHHQPRSIPRTSPWSAPRPRSGSALDFDWDVMIWGGAVIDDLSFCDGPGPLDGECLIPAETLAPGIYDLRLTLTNTDNGDVDAAVLRDLNVRDGHPEPTSPGTPRTPRSASGLPFRSPGSGPPISTRRSGPSVARGVTRARP